jgi:hypothetical protein
VRYLEDEGEGEICRVTDLSEVGEENPVRILKNHRRGALVVGSHLWVTRVDLGKKKERRERRGAEASFYTPKPDLSDISDPGSDMSDTNRIYPAKADLANFLQRMVSVGYIRVGMDKSDECRY